MCNILPSLKEKSLKCLMITESKCLPGILVDWSPSKASDSSPFCTPDFALSEEESKNKFIHEV